jgi:3-oxoacyl-[acyl-carrier protein] reductase
MSEEKWALVTGAAKGIGAACARALAADAFKVIVNYRSSAGEAEALAGEIGGVAVAGDVAKIEDCDALIAKVKDVAGRLDVLVNNAGVNVNGPLMMMSIEDIDKVRAVTRGALYLTKLAIRRFMFRQKSGRIINISSVVGASGNAGQVPYTMEKAGLDAMTRSLCLELMDRGILVNSVAPGFIDTAMTQELPPEIREQVVKQVPLGRIGTPEEVAEVVAFLASKGSYITGSVVHVNGGLYRG